MFHAALQNVLFGTQLMSIDIFYVFDRWNRINNYVSTTRLDLALQEVEIFALL